MATLAYNLTSAITKYTVKVRKYIDTPVPWLPSCQTP